MLERSLPSRGTVLIGRWRGRRCASRQEGLGSQALGTWYQQCPMLVDKRFGLLHVDLSWELVDLKSIITRIVVLKLVIRYLFLVESEVCNSISIRTPP
jgi:hypothetical protein